MATIHGMVWIIVGIVIATTAFLIDNLAFFRYIGFAFIIFGALKLLMNFITKPKENKFDKSREQLDSGQRIRGATHYCANCGAGGAGNFCRRCGNRL